MKACCRFLFKLKRECVVDVQVAETKQPISQIEVKDENNDRYNFRRSVTVGDKGNQRQPAFVFGVAELLYLESESVRLSEVNPENGRTVMSLLSDFNLDADNGNSELGNSFFPLDLEDINSIIITSSV